MPLETAGNIAELVVTNPTAGDPAGSTDNHLKLIKAALKGSFKSFSGEANVTLSETEINALPGAISSIANKLGSYVLPHLEQKGSIKPWPTNYAAIPAGWQLADGTNDTPDLRGVAVIGANGSTFQDGMTYGAATATTSESGAHNHGGTKGHALTVGEMPPHDHGGATVWDSTKNEGSSIGPDYDPSDKDGREVSIQSQGGGQEHSHDINDDGKHSHTVSTMQPSMALSWIIKTGEPKSSEIATAITDAMKAAGLN
ncbi:tail fiber protein [Microbulbifer sp. THAF38]|uniref:tail fiber protein n=1 Tax=Microbulbifer sp. THAF38 TaxID=2587856 RepID=UPI0012684001|nr:tail fiber protein [Microbulbifer sp. THAF38]QFT55577.1 hypothetical protein FIU95_13565 [Microbulbifer sp. THAF38]